MNVRHGQDSISTENTLTDEVLMARFQAGDRDALTTLFQRHANRVHRFVQSKVRNSALAEDLVQETFVRVFRAADRYRPSSRFTTWLLTIARNLCIDELRKARLRRHPSLDAEREGGALRERIPCGSPPVDVVAAEKQAVKRLAEALRLLPPCQRAVVMGRGAELTFREIAEKEGIPVDTAKSRMRYAMAVVRGDLSPSPAH